MPSLVSEYAAGTLFGAALFAAGVFAPSTIVAQMKLEDFTMVKAMLGASATSALVVHLADSANLAAMKPRTPQSIGFFPYDGNIVGGAMIGIGMALTGACPGTVFVQAGAGLPSGIFVLGGGILGGLLFVSAQPAIARLRESSGSSSSSEAVTKTELTVPKSMGISPRIVVAMWEIMCFGMLQLLSGLESPSTGTRALVSPVLGGLLIGTAQACTIALTRHTVGTSGAFEDVGRWLRNVCSGDATKGPITASVMFDAGIMSASALLARFLLPAAVTQVSSQLVTPTVAIAGGAVMAFGSRLAGGCTSGHGISGMATFSWASLVSVGSMFAAGVLTAALR
ncbi:hypothetical protein AUEXF2481DRAFT_32650 [Aureobasidium subglaciale EXF-2481]|uniref:Uncharacterized protein n=1 Tax=Aureobasidium subglaciale (strain EXF-2481) TaxID=1043005 RepID=A0A074Y7E0_AURSE|nr:uncharacterized protein AUEXF2481DRAFT_32650 [Aureobasidium subglaciale EXF-2481]KAI5204093.1 hypothetical protein E4T38_04867 [Aureobasidium subglaciale]KAI5222831.1 hypothetical protein E4T40_04781 [Aureobasidium subglaciale]KAI5226650.1 hypothetical protein E4T41_04724 [Aureobasidium subglaciale]KAI5263054.1 hypothetical protein E4T46_03969 [Aureobasidium subglaciale]KEQ91909.1 hypothetical protein AUEXF2481DRAFT_32650 [Aureobasidium subglaciale EXF-2481]